MGPAAGRRAALPWSCGSPRRRSGFHGKDCTVSAATGVGAVFDPVLAVDPGREALVTRSGRWSYAELDVLADRTAAALWALGLRPGDRVAMALPNDVDAVTVFHAAM